MDLRKKLAAAREIKDGGDRVRALASLVQELNEELKILVLQEALATIREIKDVSYHGAWAFMYLSPYLNEKLKTQALSIIREIKDENVRVRALLSLAPNLNEELKIQVLAMVHEIKNEQGRASFLMDLAPHLDDQLKAQSFQNALDALREIKDEPDRARALIDYAPYLHLSENIKEQVLQEALAAVREIKYHGERIQTLEYLLPQLNEKLKTQALQEALDAARAIKDEHDRVRALESLAPLVNEKIKEQILQEARSIEREIEEERAIADKIDDEYHRLLTLVARAPKKNDELRKQALSLALKIKGEYARIRALESLIPYLRKELKTQALQEAFAATGEIKDYYGHFSILAKLAPLLKEKLKTQVLREAFSFASDIKDEHHRVWAMKSLAPLLNEKIKKQILQEAHEIRNEDSRVNALTALAPQLNEELKKQALAITRKINDKNTLVHGLESLAPHLNDKLKTQVLQEASATKREIKKELEQESNANEIYEEVSFTAFHPKEGSIKSWHTLLVYTHVLSALAKVQEDAKRFDDQIQLPKETTSKSSPLIARGTELTIIPSCDGITFNPERFSFKWMEDFHRADFRFRADQALSGDAAKGNIDIYVGPLIIGTLKFAMLFNDKELQPVPDYEEQAKMYGKDDVFISYSRKDSDVARAFKNILEGTGLDVFLDVDNLRSGQLWEDELKRRIECAKIFQIIWSANYSQSENCKLEWEYALRQNKDEGYIRPVFWKKPLSPKPPEELNKFNFKYVELKIANVE
jgi:hypothetical protein